MPLLHCLYCNAVSIGESEREWCGGRAVIYNPCSVLVNHTWVCTLLKRPTSWQRLPFINDWALPPIEIQPLLLPLSHTACSLLSSHLPHSFTAISSYCSSLSFNSLFLVLSPCTTFLFWLCCLFGHYKDLFETTWTKAAFKRCRSIIAENITIKSYKYVIINI